MNVVHFDKGHGEYKTAGGGKVYPFEHCPIGRDRRIRVPRVPRPEILSFLLSLLLSSLLSLSPSLLRSLFDFVQFPLGFLKDFDPSQLAQDPASRTRVFTKFFTEFFY